MVPPEPQVPPRALGASQRARTPPVATSKVLSLVSAKKPMLELSGDQKGKDAPCVPTRRRSVPLRRERYQSSSPAPNTMLEPSGERTGGAPVSPSNWKEVSLGGKIGRAHV